MISHPPTTFGGHSHYGNGDSLKHKHSSKYGNTNTNAGSRFRWIPVTVYARLPPPLFSLKPMACDALTREISD